MGMHGYWFKNKKFTLIELLIVIGIMAILVAMLLPALGRVKYQAKLVSCMSNQKQVATAVFVYANSNNNRHLDRSIPLSDTRGYPAPYSVKETGITNPFDARDYLSEHIPFGVFQCPFHPRSDYMASSADHIRGNYTLYSGWLLMPGEKQMKKPGDRMTLNGKEYNVLVSDTIFYYGDRPFVQSSHPDYGWGTMKHNVKNDSTITMALYSLGGSLQRGPVDMNFAFGDGSVETIRRITATSDPKVNQVSYKYGNDSKAITTRWSLLPEAN